MRLGITHYILEDDADLSLKTFVLKCLLQSVGYVDEELKPIFFIADTNHLDLMNKAISDLERLNAMSDADIKAEIDIEFGYQFKILEKNNDESARIRNNLDLLKSKIDAWTVPSNKFESLKTMVAVQIDAIIKHECDMRMGRLQKMSVASYRETYSALYSRDIKYHREMYDFKVKEAEEINKWISDLFAALEGVE